MKSIRQKSVLLLTCLIGIVVAALLVKFAVAERPMPSRPIFADRIVEYSDWGGRQWIDREGRYEDGKGTIVDVDPEYEIVVMYIHTDNSRYPLVRRATSQQVQLVSGTVDHIESSKSLHIKRPPDCMVYLIDSRSWSLMKSEQIRSGAATQLSKVLPHSGTNFGNILGDLTGIELPR